MVLGSNNKNISRGNSTRLVSKLSTESNTQYSKSISLQQDNDKKNNGRKIQLKTCWHEQWMY